MNSPYVKQVIDGVFTNPITKENPFHNSTGTNRKERRMGDKYIVLTNSVTGEFVGKLRTKGNNRANTSSRVGVNSRMNNSNARIVA